MKRAVFFILAAPLFLALGAADLRADPIAWVNGERARAGLGSLEQDSRAMQAAQAYAGLLAGLGRISHTGPDGSDALTRYLRAGGTSARVGEIIGAGPDLEAVQKAWMSSPDHRASILKGLWTHAGWGSARSGSAVVWVVLFVQARTAGLGVREGAGGERVISGRFLPGDAAGALLLCGAARLQPLRWDPADRSFTFRVAPETDFRYARLCYLTAEGALVVTDVLTSPRGRVSPQD